MEAPNVRECSLLFKAKKRKNHCTGVVTFSAPADDGKRTWTKPRRDGKGECHVHNSFPSPA